MSDAMMANLTDMAESMTYDEVLSAISLLLDRLKKPFIKEKERVSKERAAIDSLRELSDSLHLTSNGRGWTREELYER